MLIDEMQKSDPKLIKKIKKELKAEKKKNDKKKDKSIEIKLKKESNENSTGGESWDRISIVRQHNLLFN